MDIPSAVYDLAISEAEAMRHTWLGSVHLLIGISRSQSLAGRALQSLELTPHVIEVAAQDLLAGRSDDPEGPAQPTWSLNPVAWRVINWADGFATGRGERLGEDHVLVSIAWDNACFTSALFRHLNVPRDRVLNAMRHLGFDIAGHVPPDREVTESIAPDDPLYGALEALLADADSRTKPSGVQTQKETPRAPGPPRVEGR